MFDIAWSEMFVIVVVALIVIGPKDLPRLIREVGRWTAKARGMAREFQRSFDDMVREAELDDIRKTVEQARPSNLSKTIREAIDPEGELDHAFEIEEAQRKAKASGEPAEPATGTAPAQTPPAQTPSASPPPVTTAPPLGQPLPSGPAVAERPEPREAAVAVARDQVKP